MNVSRCDQNRLPVMKSCSPSPSTSPYVAPCSCEKITPPAFFVEKSVMIGCSTNDRVPSAAFFCSNHDNPRPCACSDVTTSLRPSPLTSYTAISAPPGLDRVHLPNAAGWYFQVPGRELWAVGCGPAGCSHQP